MNHPPNILNTLFMLILIITLINAFSPKNAFAGSGVGWTPSIHFFTEGVGGATQTPPPTGAATDEPQNPDAEPNKEPEDIQEFAARVAKEDQERIDRGASAPNIPATSQNLARFHQRDTLPEQEKQALQPIEPPKSEAVAAEPPAPPADVTEVPPV